MFGKSLGPKVAERKARVAVPREQRCTLAGEYLAARGAPDDEDRWKRSGASRSKERAHEAVLVQRECLAIAAEKVPLDRCRRDRSSADRHRERDAQRARSRLVERCLGLVASRFE